MVRVPVWILIVAAIGLPGCSVDSDNSFVAQAQQVEHEYQQDSWRARYLELGRVTYEQVCASCHDGSKDGAPAKGDRKSWNNRSPLWAAVLFEHAKTGYLDMPAKGGHPELTEKSVEAAGEYMLSETFPELLRD